MYAGGRCVRHSKSTNLHAVDELRGGKERKGDTKYDASTWFEQMFHCTTPSWTLRIYWFVAVSSNKVASNKVLRHFKSENWKAFHKAQDANIEFFILFDWVTYQLHDPIMQDETKDGERKAFRSSTPILISLTSYDSRGRFN